MNNALTLDGTMSQWADLGIHTEVCMTRPETCGEAGGAISMWVNVIGCQGWDGGIISTLGFGRTGAVIFCGHGHFK